MYKILKDFETFESKTIVRYKKSGFNLKLSGKYWISKEHIINKEQQFDLKKPRLLYPIIATIEYCI